MQNIVLLPRHKYIICQSIRNGGRYCKLAKQLKLKAGTIRKFGFIILAPSLTSTVLRK